MKNKINYKRIALIVISILIVILIFTFFDYMIHQLSKDYAVPSKYFRNKIIYGTIIGSIIYYFARNKKPFVKSLIFSAVVTLLLQVRYFIEGYPLDFVVLFLFIHFAILTPVSYLAFKIINTKELKTIKKKR